MFCNRCLRDLTKNYSANTNVISNTNPLLDFVKLIRLQSKNVSFVHLAFTISVWDSSFSNSMHLVKTIYLAWESRYLLSSSQKMFLRILDEWIFLRFVSFSTSLSPWINDGRYRECGTLSFSNNTVRTLMYLYNTKSYESKQGQHLSMYLRGNSECFSSRDLVSISYIYIYSIYLHTIQSIINH